MNAKINVLEIGFHDITAKEAMREVMGYMRTEPVNIVELINSDVLLRSKEDETLKDHVAQSDLVLAGERDILELAGIMDRRKLQETESRLFTRMLLRFFHKNHSRVFLLVETRSDLLRFNDYLEEYYRGIEIVGMEFVPNDPSMDDMILNSINGAEADCVISVLPAPLQEKFVVRNRILLNTRLWLGLGKNAQLPPEKKEKKPFREFIIRLFLKREVEKEKQKKRKCI